MGVKKKLWTRREDVLLCQPMDDKKLARVLYHAAFAQPKLDGVRCRAVYDEAQSSYVLLSSENNPITSCPHIVISLNDIPSERGRPELDGELYRHGLPFEKISGLASRKAYKPECLQLQYHIFDYVDEKARQSSRFAYLNRFLSDLTSMQSDYLKQVRTIAVESTNDLWEAYGEFIAKGYEGIIVRSSTNFYVRKRSPDVLKFKPKKKDWYLIQGLAEAYSEDNQPLGRVGAFILRNEGETTFRAGLGIGVTHDVATMWWEDRLKLVGKYAEIEYQQLTDKNGVPRFGKLITISDTSGELS